MVSFRKSIRLGKGLRLNFSKRGIGVSTGIPGFRVGMNSRGTYVSTGIPGTGIYDRKYISPAGGADRRGARPSPAAGAATGRGSASPSPGLPASTIFRVPPALTHGRVGWGWAVLFFLLGFAWQPLFVAAIILGIFAIATAAAPQAKAAARVRQGLGAVQAGNWTGAVESFRAAQEAFPDLPELKGLLGFALAGAGRSAEAEPYLEAACAAVPDPTLGLALAAVAVDTGNAERAVEVLQALPPAMADLPAVINLLGQAFLNLGRYEAAAETLRRGPLRKREMTPEKLECHYLLGRAYLGLGENARARREFERVMAQDADYRDVRALLREAGGKLGEA